MPQSIRNKAIINDYIQSKESHYPNKNAQELSTIGKFSFCYSDHRGLNNSMCFGDHSKDEVLAYIGHMVKKNFSLSFLT